MKKNILAENMRRFGTKNLHEDQEKDNFLNKINIGSIEFDGIDHNDYPDYVDAYISYAEFEDGTALNDDQLELLTSYNDWWYDMLWDRLH